MVYTCLLLLYQHYPFFYFCRVHFIWTPQEPHPLDFLCLFGAGHCRSRHHLGHPDRSRGGFGMAHGTLKMWRLIAGKICRTIRDTNTGMAVWMGYPRSDWEGFPIWDFQRIRSLRNHDIIPWWIFQVDYQKEKWRFSSDCLRGPICWRWRVCFDVLSLKYPSQLG